MSVSVHLQIFYEPDPDGSVTPKGDIRVTRTHISRKSRRSDHYGGGDNGCQLLHGSPPKTCRNLPCSRPGDCYRVSTVNLNFSPAAMSALGRFCCRSQWARRSQAGNSAGDCSSTAQHGLLPRVLTFDATTRRTLLTQRTVRPYRVGGALAWRGDGGSGRLLQG